MDKHQRLEKLIAGVPVAMLTAAEDGEDLRSRPMLAPAQKFDGALWFFIEATGAKFLGGKSGVPVNLSYIDSERERFVSVSGKAKLVKSAERIEKMWSPTFSAWFPKGKADPQLALLQVEVTKAEGWDAQRGGHVKLDF
jgi:general stress protein 26